MARYTRSQPEPRDAWIMQALDEHDDYDARRDPHTDRYVPQNRYTGPDFRQVKAQEIDRFPGQPTRIDFVTLGDGTPVKRLFLAGWIPGDKPWRAERLADGWTIEQALAHLEARGWTVRRWAGGARAWRCGQRPVRAGEYMRRMRDRLAANPPAGVQVHSLDLLYDL